VSAPHNKHRFFAVLCCIAAWNAAAWPRIAAIAALLCAPTARAQSPLPPALLDGAAGLLADWIDASRAQVLQQGAQPIPPQILPSLLGFFPASLLSGVRYAIGSEAGYGLPALAFAYGDAAAMTLGNVVVFRNDHDAQTDLKLWAHELTHVQQYERWGIQGFAARYVRDTTAVEREAYANADRFIAWHRNHPSPGASRPWFLP